MCSTQITPSWLALCASQGGPTTIADRVDARLAGAQPLVDDDMGALDLDLGAFEADILDIADDADREDDALDGRRSRSCRRPRAWR